MKNDKHMDDLVAIRAIMERSTRFLSLSGLSGIFAGVYALLGASLVYFNLGNNPGSTLSGDTTYPLPPAMLIRHYSYFLLIAVTVLVLSIGTCIYLSMRKASKSDEKMLNPASRRFLINLLIPLVTGGVFCIELLRQGLTEWIAPSLLIFYGLALINGSKYTLDDIRYLGVCEILIGLIALFIPGYGLLFWSAGFGILHIIYGSMMYYKYEA
jgi:uncharacterized membrane protein HdeD (DUF308 family)